MVKDKEQATVVLYGYETEDGLSTLFSREKDLKEVYNLEARKNSTVCTFIAWVDKPFDDEVFFMKFNQFIDERIKTASTLHSGIAYEIVKSFVNQYDNGRA